MMGLSIGLPLLLGFSTLSFRHRTVEAACAQALKEGVHSADVVINILAGRRDPGAPVTIMTPEALRLSCPPTADCARYDSLRRTP